MTHWFDPPEDTCVECGQPSADANHLRRCAAVWSFGPGFAFCEEPQGHDGPHRLRNWDGTLYVGPGKKKTFKHILNDGTIEKVK